jgi:hypothetical protein
MLEGKSGQGWHPVWGGRDVPHLNCHRSGMASQLSVYERVVSAFSVHILKAGAPGFTRYHSDVQLGERPSILFFPPAADYIAIGEV